MCSDVLVLLGALGLLLHMELHSCHLTREKQGVVLLLAAGKSQLPAAVHDIIVADLVETGV